jgi:hypothetical protein
MVRPTDMQRTFFAIRVRAVSSKALGETYPFGRRSFPCSHVFIVARKLALCEATHIQSGCRGSILDW